MLCANIRAEADHRLMWDSAETSHATTLQHPTLPHCTELPHPAPTTPSWLTAMRHHAPSHRNALQHHHTAPHCNTAPHRTPPAGRIQGKLASSQQARATVQKDLRAASATLFAYRICPTCLPHVFSPRVCLLPVTQPPWQVRFVFLEPKPAHFSPCQPQSGTCSAHAAIWHEMFVISALSTLVPRLAS